MEVAMIKRAEETSTNPTVVSGITKSRGDKILCWRLELAENRNVLLDICENGLLLVLGKATLCRPSGTQICALDIFHVNVYPLVPSMDRVDF